MWPSLLYLSNLITFLPDFTAYIGLLFLIILFICCLRCVYLLFPFSEMLFPQVSVQMSLYQGGLPWLPHLNSTPTPNCIFFLSLFHFIFFRALSTTWCNICVCSLSSCLLPLEYKLPKGWDLFFSSPQYSRHLWAHWLFFSLLRSCYVVSIA